MDSSTIPASLFAPINGLAEQARSHRHCKELPDAQWLRLGVARVLSDARSGRWFLQQFYHWLADTCPTPSHFFGTLKSQRRLKLVQEISSKSASLLGSDGTDRPEFKKFDLYAGDGHWHDAATHDPLHNGEKTAVGHLYALNLRTHAMTHLTQAIKPKENDMGAISRIGPKAMRLGAGKGRKVLWVWDRAGINFQLWHKWKKLYGIYFISRTKANMRLEILSENPVSNDPINAGVIADQLMQTSQHVYVRMVTYRAPSGEVYQFITSDETLAPGLIAWLYLRRWELEKTYDEFKNKFFEGKAWGSSEEAKTMQAEFLCLAHNLLTLFERQLKTEHKIENVAGEKKAAKRRAKLKEKAEQVSALLTKIIRPLQRSVKLLRWMRANWLTKAPLCEILPHLRTLYATE